MADRMVIIEHTDGRRVAVTPRDFAHAKVGPAGETYEEMKFKIVSYEDGTDYEPPAPKAKPSDG